MTSLLVWHCAERDDGACLQDIFHVVQGTNAPLTNALRGWMQTKMGASTRPTHPLTATTVRRPWHATHQCQCDNNPGWSHDAAVGMRPIVRAGHPAVQAVCACLLDFRDCQDERADVVCRHSVHGQ